ncbi:hypothetical protein RZS08_61410, partial [Arthrospira platensis SPKY1]|nr:hypothetical protein [Arthrospira platensis SPKY1]
LDIRTEKLLDVGESMPAKFPKREALFVLVDRLAVEDTEEFRSRLAGSIEAAYREAGGRCVLKQRDGELLAFSERFERDGIDFVEPSPQFFAFNNPYGACPTCEGF